MLSTDGPVSEKYSKALDDYFQHFVQPEFYGEDDGVSVRRAKPVSCVNCGAPMQGTPNFFKLGAKHGEFVCADCGWPGRFIHVVRDPEDATVTLVHLRNFPMMVHPDFVRKAENKKIN